MFALEGLEIAYFSDNFIFSSPKKPKNAKTFSSAHIAKTTGPMKNISRALKVSNCPQNLFFKVRSLKK